MTTMHTSYGRYQWFCLPFGITSAPEEFQMRLKTALEGLDGIVCIADDILVFGEGNDYAEVERDHDRQFIALMERCHHKNIKLNPQKLQFKLKEVKFMGTILTHQGMKSDPDKVAAITQLPKPQDKPALLRFIGMVNYLSPFCANLSSEIQPLRMLTQTAVPLRPYWNYRDELSFQNGIIYKGMQVMVPQSMHKEMLSKIHANHSGADSNIRMAREVLFWQGMRKAIQATCDACGICNQCCRSATKEPMKSLPVPSRPWEIVSQDICEQENQPYLVTLQRACCNWGNL